MSGADLRLGPHILEYPRRYTLRASVDGATWQVVGTEKPTVPPFVSYRRDHLNVELPLRMAPARARYLEIVVPPDPPNASTYSPGSWGVHEMRLYEPGDGRP